MLYVLCRAQVATKSAHITLKIKFKINQQENNKTLETFNWILQKY